MASVAAACRPRPPAHPAGTPAPPALPTARCEPPAAARCRSAQARRRSPTGWPPSAPAPAAGRSSRGRPRPTGRWCGGRAAPPARAASPAVRPRRARSAADTPAIPPPMTATSNDGAGRGRSVKPPSSSRHDPGYSLITFLVRLAQRRLRHQVGDGPGLGVVVPGVAHALEQRAAERHQVDRRRGIEEAPDGEGDREVVDGRARGRRSTPAGGRRPGIPGWRRRRPRLIACATGSGDRSASNRP